MQANKIRLLEFVGGSKRTFNIPVYQRNYDWKKEQCEQFFYDIEKIIEEKFEYEHFLGTIVYVQGYLEANFMEFIVIDGQQRITTLMLFLKALHDLLDDENDKLDLRESYLLNVRAKEPYRIKLKPVSHDIRAYEKLLKDDFKEETNIYNNYKLLKELVEKSSYSAKDFYRALNFVEIVYISLDKEKPSENPQMIFESLNSTGLSLLPSDLIRNFLLMNHDYETQTRLFTDYWVKVEEHIPNAMLSGFARDYLTMKTAVIPAVPKIYSAFKGYYKSLDKRSQEDILQDLLVYAEYYSWFSNCNSPVKRVNQLLVQINDMKSSVVYPVLLHLFKVCFTDKKLSTSELEKILQLFIAYLFRRTVCSMPTNALNKAFASLCKELSEKNDAENSYGLIARFLLSKNNRAIFPRDEQFELAFLEKDFYNLKNVKNILMVLEQRLHKETVKPDELQVEHIMPQKLSPQWEIDLGSKGKQVHERYKHTIGNLTLTGYNQKLSNQGFLEKKKTYKTSNITLSRGLAKYAKWNEESIQKRAQELFLVAKDIWLLPVEYEQSARDEVSYNVEYNIMDNVNVTGQKPKSLIVNEESFVVESWKEFFVVLSKKLYEVDRDLFDFFANNVGFQGWERKIISRKDSEMRSPAFIGGRVFIETSLSANDIINYCKIITERFSMQDDVYYVLRFK